MKKATPNNIFYNHMPTIDLHGLDRDTAKLVVKDFISDNIVLKKHEIIIIHGIGTGILRKTIHEELRRNKNVISYQTDNFNMGMTIIKLKIDKF